MKKDLGIDVEKPEKECHDFNCPFHGKLPVRGRVIEGVVVSDKAQKITVVLREYLKKIRKYERYEKRKSKIHAHNPFCINAKVGDIVKMAECRPLSKTKSFVIVEKRRKVEK